MHDPVQDRCQIPRQQLTSRIASLGTARIVVFRIAQVGTGILAGSLDVADH